MMGRKTFGPMPQEELEAQDTGNVSFSLETELVKAYNTSHLNLYVSSTDIPSVDDIDNDGDFDVITFSIFGSNLEYHKNLSVENYEHATILSFG